MIAASCAAHGAETRAGSADSPRSSRALRQLRTDLSTIFNAPVMNRAVWGVDVRAVHTGEHIFQFNAGKLMMPASNMKILTLAAAAEALGWDARFTTTLDAVGSVGGGSLDGDLVVRGGGDPTINSREARAAAVFDEWAIALKAAGIEHIEGRIVGDDQAFDDDRLGQGWAWDYLQYGYAAPVGSLQYNENVAALQIQAGSREGDTPFVQLEAGTGLTVVNRAVTGPTGSLASIDFNRHLDRPVLELTGSIPLGSAVLSRSVAVVNPTIFFAQALKDALIAHCITVSGDAVDMDDVAAEFAAWPRDVHAIARTESPTLREIGSVLMKVSQNLYAETLLKAAGATGGALGTTEGGRAAARAIFDGWGIARDAYVQADGSGLSRYNYVTAETIATILERLHKDAKHRDSFLATLPIAGKDGTLATRMRRTRADGNAVAKTGSISNVRSLSGYVRTRDGETFAFAMLANDFIIPAATVNWIADLAVETLANFARR
jgi:D-alanyl-D-alanine carboxypeptidase/D-alanyl-D-alanine-endopeptidase (penicillin-binding protein 4)